MSESYTQETSIVIDAPALVIFDLASPVERWPILLAHYRSVTLIAERAEGREFRMRARRGKVPVNWRSVVNADREKPSIHFVHTGGFSKGMKVEWRFDPVEDGKTRVTIVHDARSMTSRVRRRLMVLLVGRVFVDPIARKTLMCFKASAESRHREPEDNDP